MRVRNLATDEAAVSSVIAVVLMVALTIVLAASVGVFVLGIGQEATNQAGTPNVKYATEYVNESGTGTLSISVKGGDTVKAENIEVIVGGKTAWKDGSPEGEFSDGSGWSAEIKSGDTLTLEADDPADVSAGDRLMIVWKNGDTSTILLDRTI
jgi:FlaG/FlaF family flagellin (archaellin)